MHVVILGNGISGISTARFIRKLSDHKITVVSAETEFFFSRTALMYVYMGHMRFQDTQPYENYFWKKNRIDLVQSYIPQINFKEKKLIREDGGEIPYDKLVLALGSASNKFGWPGQDLDRVHGLYSKQDLDAMEKYSDGLNKAVIVGGGLIGIEMAEMFHSRHIPVTMLVRETNYWNNVLPEEEASMISRHILEQGIDLRLGTELKEIVDDGNGAACAAIDNKGDRIECGFVGLTAGVHPNVKFLKESGLEIQKGIVVNDYLETNIADVYAIGDCAQLANPKPGRRPVEAIWYTGKMMGETLAYNLCGKKIAYDPGIWFNSAKFFDIEYQVYGSVLAKPPENHQSIYWEHPDGKKSIRLVFDSNDQGILGFNLMGIRYRHEVCEKWLAAKAPITEVIQNLSLANFDPEFYPVHEQEVAETYSTLTGNKITSSKKSTWNQVFSFLKS